MNKYNKIKVAVGMSGGVDSSVAAALLKKQGYDVFGVFFHFWAEKSGEGAVRENICCSLESMEDARRVAQKLGIKFYTINVAVKFKETIVDEFIEEYRAGRTPNPCVRCNRYIKFGDALEKVQKFGADYLATGHYARIKKKGYMYRLYKGKDETKDQTYFLHQLTQEQLSKIMFPLGKFKKTKVRKLAAKFGLPTASKKESQEVCFIPDGDVEGFLNRYIKFEVGEIKDIETDEVLGTHSGVQKYTIGQRKGIGLSGGPWYVAKLDIKNNILWVTRAEEDIELDELKIKQIHWIGRAPDLPVKVKCKIRYGTTEKKAEIHQNEEGEYEVLFDEPQKAITSGQFAVFWRKGECLGGGVIE